MKRDGVIDTLASLVRAGLAWAPDFNGRATRTELGLTFFACVAASMLAALASGFGAPDWRWVQGMFSGFIILLPWIAVMVRRLHDTNRSASALFTILFPYVGIVILGGILLMDGFAGENATGPDPRERRGRTRYL